MKTMEYSINIKPYNLIPDNGIDLDSLTKDEKFLIKDGILSFLNFENQSVIRNISKRYHLDFIEFDKCKVYLCRNQIKLK